MRGRCGGAIDRELLKWKKDKEDISSRMHTLSIIAEAAASLHMCAQVQSSIERPLHVHIQRGSRSMCGKQHMSNHLCHIDMHLITSSAARHHNMSARKKKTPSAHCTHAVYQKGTDSGELRMWISNAVHNTPGLFFLDCLFWVKRSHLMLMNVLNRGARGSQEGETDG